MQRRSHFLLILCWLAYFAVPLVNGIGQSGVQRIELCTTLGVETYFVYDNASDHEATTSHQSSHSCPCTHFFMDTAYDVQGIYHHSKPTASLTFPTQPPQRIGVAVIHARAPPALITFSDDQKLA